MKIEWMNKQKQNKFHKMINRRNNDWMDESMLKKLSNGQNKQKVALLKWNPQKVALLKWSPQKWLYEARIFWVFSKWNPKELAPLKRNQPTNQWLFKIAEFLRSVEEPYWEVSSGLIKGEARAKEDEGKKETKKKWREHGIREWRENGIRKWR